MPIGAAKESRGGKIRFAPFVIASSFAENISLPVKLSGYTGSGSHWWGIMTVALRSDLADNSGSGDGASMGVHFYHKKLNI